MGYWIDGFNRLSGTMTARQRARLTAMYLLIAYVHAAMISCRWFRCSAVILTSSPMLNRRLPRCRFCFRIIRWQQPGGHVAEVRGNETRVSIRAQR